MACAHPLAAAADSAVAAVVEANPAAAAGFWAPLPEEGGFGPVSSSSAV